MKAIQLHTPGDPVQVTDVPEPVCGPGDVVIAVEACGLCRSDWHVWHGGWAWEGIRPTLPVILGHEVAGRIVEAGPTVTAVCVDDRVTAPFHHSCGRCVRCRNGRGNLCTAADYPGSSVDGGFAEFMRIRAADVNCVLLPDNLATVHAAALGCRYMTAWHAVTAVGRAAVGETASVHGCGGLGLSIIQIASTLGLDVIAVDLDEDALALARRAGATTTVNAHDEDPATRIEELTRGGVELSFDAAGSSDAAIASVRGLRPGGRHVQVGLTGRADSGRITWPADRIVFRELEIRGSIGNPIGDYRPLMSLISTGRLRPAELVTTTTTLRQAAQLIPDLDTVPMPGLATTLI